MKSNELRIGNLTDKGVIKSFYEHGVHVGMGKCFSFNELHPVEITCDILLKYGFKKSSPKQYVSDAKNLRTATIYECGIIVWNENTKMTWVGNCCIDNVEYFHDIQNLFFALTGTELV